MKERLVEVWTDGSCNYRTGKGGLGCYFKFGEHEHSISKGYSNTTIGRMELKAIIVALQTISDKDCSVTIYSDSQYIINTMNLNWIEKWEREGWVERKNVDLWKEFISEYSKFQKEKVKFIHIRGHQGIEGNEIADLLADYKVHEKFEVDLK